MGNIFSQHTDYAIRQASTELHQHIQITDQLLAFHIHKIACILFALIYLAGLIVAGIRQHFPSIYTQHGKIYFLLFVALNVWFASLVGGGGVTGRSGEEGVKGGEMWDQWIMVGLASGFLIWLALRGMQS